jgi:hypothetical protein
MPGMPNPAIPMLSSLFDSIDNGLEELTNAEELEILNEMGRLVSEMVEPARAQKAVAEKGVTVEQHLLVGGGTVTQERGDTATLRLKASEHSSLINLSSRIHGRISLINMAIKK